MAAPDSSPVTLVIAPAAGENFLVADITLETPIATLRGLVAAKLAVEAASIKLVFEGSELLDGGVLRAWYVSNLSTVRAVFAAAPVSTATQAAARTSAAPDGSQAESDASSLISDAEMPRAIVIRGLPPAEPAMTEKALFDAFSRFGEIARLVFQDTAAGAPAALQSQQQQAIIVFHRDAAAAASLAADGSAILGAPAHVALASSLALPRVSGSGPAATSSTAAPGERLLVPSEAVIALLARGFLYGHAGVAHVRRYDEQAGLTHRVKVWLGAQDARFHVSATVTGAYTVALAQAQQLERTWQTIDARFRIHERLDAAADAAIGSFEAAVARAMRDPTINRLATASHDFATEAYEAIQVTVAQAKERARVAFLQQQQQQQLAGTPPVPVAVAAAPASAAAAPAASAGDAVAYDPVPPAAAANPVV